MEDKQCPGCKQMCPHRSNAHGSGWLCATQPSPECTKWFDTVGWGDKRRKSKELASAIGATKAVKVNAREGTTKTKLILVGRALDIMKNHTADDKEALMNLIKSHTGLPEATIDEIVKVI